MVCHWKEVINKGLGDIKEPAATCRTGWHRRSGKSGWTADGVVIYNAMAILAVGARTTHACLSYMNKMATAVTTQPTINAAALIHVLLL